MTIAANTSPATLDQLLSTLEWQVDDSRRVTLDEDAGERYAGATFVYVVTGSVRVRSSGPLGKSYPFAAGDVAFAPGLHAVDLRAETSSEIIVTDLRLTGSARTLDVLPELLGVTQLAELDPAIALLASRMGCPRPVGEPRRAGDNVICGQMATTIIAVAIRTWAEGDCAPANWPSPTEDPYVARVLDAMHEDLAHPWTIGDLAAVGAMSRTTFAERFREQVGQSPGSYLTQVRMDAAMTYLSHDGLSVSETARMLGYESDAGFSRAFRRHTGSTPSVWRQQSA